jgi:hypothetical protein
MTDATVWVSVLHGWTITLSDGRTYAPDEAFRVGAALADDYAARGWVEIVEAPVLAPEPDRSDWLAVRVTAEIHLDGGKSYGAGEVLDLSPPEFERYASLGCVERA